ncbi:MAG TPA: ergothioneine biosynthesis protein EgtB [Chitinophagaceae bacterium]|nr:ergothioneine biosynthesis protein EgtB [Chitinophagaceae bacterium]
MNKLLSQYARVRQHSEEICKPLQVEDYVVQPVADVSPPKWHLGHTTWFFETFILKPHVQGYKEFDREYNYVFNSYYENAGARVIRTDRGNLSRPTVPEVYEYRKHVDEAMRKLLSNGLAAELHELLTLGFNHEQQHQELLCTDIKYILGHNPLFPAYSDYAKLSTVPPEKSEMITIDSGLYKIGYDGYDFCFDNELASHQVYLGKYKIASRLVTNQEYLEFINDGGYRNFVHWHSEGWDWVKSKQVNCPMYWYCFNNEWFVYTMQGLKPLNMEEFVCHISYYEAFAYASWKGKRLPSEFEWEVAADKFSWGRRWEWTQSAYLPYPGFAKAPGAIGEYNGKFMVNQMVLRGASEVTPAGHSRITYRNFFHPPLRWQYTGIRLAE